MISPFEIFEIKPTVEIDLTTLEKKYYEKCRQFHPDRVPRGDRNALIKNQEMTAQINEAYGILKNEEMRIRALLESAGLNKEVKISTPAELAEEFFSLQELLMDGDDSFLSTANQFLNKIKKNLIEELNECIEIAKNIDWQNIAADQDLAQKSAKLILEKLSLRNYLNSLVNNTENLINKSGANHE